MLFDEIVKEVCSGNRLEFRDFGVFEVVVRKPRTGRNPRTGQKVAVPPKTVVTFKMGKVMKEKVARAPGGAAAARRLNPDPSRPRLRRRSSGAWRRCGVSCFAQGQHSFPPRVSFPRPRQASREGGNPADNVTMSAPLKIVAFSADRRAQGHGARRCF